MNSFQRKARDLLLPFGVTINPIANWVSFTTPDGMNHTIMSEEGLMAIVNKLNAGQHKK